MATSASAYSSLQASDYIDDDAVENVTTVLATEDVANQPAMSLHVIGGIRTEIEILKNLYFQAEAQVEI
jgi:hypothetical protein